MALPAEYILTLQQIKGVGNKTIFKFAEQLSKTITSVDELFKFTSMSKDKKLNSLDKEDILEANNIARRIIDRSASKSIYALSYYDDNFPEVLRHTINESGNPEPPLLIWYRGNISVAQLTGLAIIGTREPTEDGIKAGLHLASEFAKRDFNIVSGLAIGCDTCGHRGALDALGKTTAILANGLDTESIYPRENQALAEEIVEAGGLLLSEYSIGTGVNRYSLVARDRLQAGLAKATLVIQTGVKGGTMHAANTTLLAKKPLFVVKYKNEFTNQHEKSQGNAYLVTKGAQYISGTDNLDEISEKIKKVVKHKTSLFD